MSGPVSWLVLTGLGVVLVVVAFRLDSYAWRVTERRQQKRFRAELAALKRIHERETR